MDLISETTDTYLTDIASAVVAAISQSIKHPFVLTSTAIRDVNEDEIENYGPGAKIEAVKYQGALYDFIAQKEKGPSKTIEMRMRQR